MPAIASGVMLLVSRRASERSAGRSSKVHTGISCATLTGVISPSGEKRRPASSPPKLVQSACGVCLRPGPPIIVATSSAAAPRIAALLIHPLVYALRTATCQIAYIA